MKREVKGVRSEANDFLSFTPYSLLLTPHPKLGHSQPGSLNKHQFSLISLIILLIISVDNSVDKLWISCGWSCG
jgi:hypothetical protein